MKIVIVTIMVMLLSGGVCRLSIAGDIDSPGEPSLGSGMYTLQQVYDYLNSGTVPPTPGPFREPSAAPGSTMKTLGEMYTDIKAQFDQCNATSNDVASGKTFFSTQAGNWGVKTGVMTPPTPTSTPTPSPTPTPTLSWYDIYGPSGEDKVVQIGSLYVAKGFSGSGHSGATATQPTILSWANGLVWLGKDDWRLPTRTEGQTICADRSLLGGYYANPPYSYWTTTPSTLIGYFYVTGLSPSACTDTMSAASEDRYVFGRAVRPAP